MKRPQYVFRPNLSDPQHRRAWALLQQVPSAKRKGFLVQAILATEQTDRLEKSIRKVVREELQAVNITGAVPSPLSENAIPEANRIIDKLQLAIVDTGTAELIDTVQQERGEPAPETERVQTEDGAVDFEIGADEEQFNMGFPQGSENASPSEPFSDSSKSFANSLSPRADQLRAKGERPSVRMELSDITAYLRRKVEPPKDRMPKMPVKIKRKEKTL